MTSTVQFRYHAPASTRCARCASRIPARQQLCDRCAEALFARLMEAQPVYQQRKRDVLERWVIYACSAIVSVWALAFLAERFF